MNKKLNQIYIKHENEINIGKNKNFVDTEKIISYEKEIQNKNKEILLLKKELEEIKNKMNKPKTFGSDLEINNNLNSMNIEAIKPKYNELILKLNQNISKKENIDITNVKIYSQEEINKNVYTLIENKIKKEKEWNSLSIDKNKSIELRQNENIDIKDFEIILKSNQKINSLIKEKIIKEN